jgi:hypothetical protein
VGHGESLHVHVGALVEGRQEGVGRLVDQHVGVLRDLRQAACSISSHRQESDGSASMGVGK